MRVTNCWSFLLGLGGVLCILVGTVQLVMGQDSAKAEVEQLLTQGLAKEKVRDYTEAFRLVKEALRISTEKLGPQHPHTAAALNNLGSLYQQIGDYPSAQAAFERALAICENLPGRPGADYTTILNNLGLLYMDQGDYVRAEQLLERVIEIDEPFIGPLTLASDLQNLAVVVQRKGDHVKALSLFDRSLKIINDAITQGRLLPGNPKIAISLNNVGRWFDSGGDIEFAERLYTGALTIAEQSLGKEHPNTAIILNNLAGIYERRGDHDRAEASLQRAIKIYETAHDPNLGGSINNLGLLYQKRGNLTQAKTQFESAMSLLEKTLGPNHPIVATVLSNLAVLTVRQGDLHGALSLLKRANELRERNLESILMTGSESQKRLFVNASLGEFDGTVSFHLQFARSNSEALELALLSILRRKGRVIDVLSDQVKVVRRSLAGEDQKLFRQLEISRSQVATLMLSGPPLGDKGQFRADLSRLENEEQRLEAELSRHSSKFRNRLMPLTLSRVRSAIPSDGVLIEFVVYKPFNLMAQSEKERWGSPRYAAYLLWPSDKTRAFDLGEKSIVDRKVADFRAMLRRPVQDPKPAAQELYNQVMAPIHRSLGKTRRVLLAPDGALNLVPFGALMDEKNSYLLEHFSFIYLSSGRDLLRMSSTFTSKNKSIVLANPTFDSDANNRSASVNLPKATTRHYDALPASAVEGEEIATLLGVRPVMDSSATETFLKNVERPRILHIATHAFFTPIRRLQSETGEDLGPVDSFSALTPLAFPENPLFRSGLVLSGANDRDGGNGEDGILTALEASSLNLDGTALVVLSACETGVGDVLNGEGVYGLRRAFEIAGAETLLLSLWKVDDTNTQELMLAFYRGLKRLERGEGLRQVQLNALRRRKTSHPYYWAAFIESGNWKKLS